MMCFQARQRLVYNYRGGSKNQMENWGGIRLLKTSEDFSPSDPNAVTATDEFELHSTHISMRVDGTLAAYIRLTPPPTPVTYYIDQHHEVVKRHNAVAYAGRSVVNPAFKNSSLYEAIVSELCAEASVQGYPLLCAGVRPHRSVAKRCQVAGFVFDGIPLDFIDLTGRFLVQPLLLDLAGKPQAMWKEMAASFLDKGWTRI
jgi:hypothetical protein